MNTPPVCFLGAYRSMVQVSADQGTPVETNILGLSDDIASCIYPFSLSGLGIGIGIFEPALRSKYTLIFRNHETGEFFEIVFQMTVLSQIPSGIPEPSFEGQGWMKIFANAPKDTMVIKPGRYAVNLKTENEEQLLGYLNFHFWQPDPLTPASIEAIKADPMARKFIRYRLVCKKCKDEVRCYTGVERGGQSEATGWIWQNEVPDTFKCSCGSTSLSLEYVKKGLHGLLAKHTLPANDMTSIFSLYDQTALEEYCRQFRRLLDSRPAKEEILQKFLDEHKVFLHRFAAQEIRSKPPILSKHNADFIILNNRKELLLIEIERSTIKLLKKAKNSYGVTAELQHAIDQIRSWRQIFDDYRDAALANIDMDKKDIAKIKGIIIAGRTPENAEETRYLRSLDLGFELYTYDDLISDVVESIRHIAGR